MAGLVPSVDCATNQGWYPVAASTDAVMGHVAAARLWGSDLVVWRDDNGTVNVWPDRCLHRGVRLSLGTNTGTELVCRYHGWRYASVAGSCTYIPAHPDNAPAQSLCTATLPAVEHGGLIWTTLDGARGSGAFGSEPTVAPFAAGDATADAPVVVLWAMTLAVAATVLADRRAEIESTLTAALTTAGLVAPLLEVVLQPVDVTATVVRPLVVGPAAEAMTDRGRQAAAEALSSMARRFEAETGRIPVAVPGDGFGQVVAQGRVTPTGLLAMEVADKWETADGIMAFELVPANGDPLPAVQPGAHIDVHMAEGLLRPYSLTSGPGDTSYRIGVKREPASRGGSEAMHDRVEVGDRIMISRPRNNFPLRRDAEHTLFIAGGIGLTPLLAMAQTLAATEASWVLHYFVRGAAHVAFAEVLERLGSNVVVHQGLDPAATGEILTGLLAEPAFGHQVYACGPGPMLDAVRNISRRSGWADDAVHFEYFQNPNEIDLESSFEIALSRSARTLRVAAGQTILEVLRADGVAVEASCEQGACGTCVVPMLDGRALHQDVFLTEAQKAVHDRIAVCVSRAETERLVLEL